MFVLVVAAMLLVLPIGASAQRCIPDVAVQYTIPGSTVAGTPWCMQMPTADPSTPDPYRSGNITPNPRGNLYGDRLWAPPANANPYRGYGNPSPSGQNTPLSGETCGMSLPGSGDDAMGGPAGLSAGHS